MVDSKTAITAAKIISLQCCWRNKLFDGTFDDWKIP